MHTQSSVPASYLLPHTGRLEESHLHAHHQQKHPMRKIPILTFSDLNRKRLPSMCFLASLQLFSFSKDSSHAHACMSHIEPASPPAPSSSAAAATAAAPPAAPGPPFPPPPVLDLGVESLGAMTGRMSATGRWESALMWRRFSSSGSAAATRWSSGADDLISPFVSLCLIYVYIYFQHRTTKQIGSRKVTRKFNGEGLTRARCLC